MTHQILLKADQQSDYPKLGDGDIVIGDVHGSLDPVHNLLKSMNYNPDKQRVHFTGDLIDRGHQSKEVLDAMNNYGWTSNMGNHDEKLARLLKGNAVKVGPELQDTVNQLGGIEEAKQYYPQLSNLPLHVPFEDSQGKGVILHAGAHPDYPLDKLSKQYTLMGRTHPFEPYNPDVPSTAPPWQDSYKGHLGHIIHGHHVVPTHDYHGNKDVSSIDQGSVFGSIMPHGGKLSGIRLGDRSVFSVPGDPKAENHYRQIWGDKLKIH